VTIATPMHDPAPRHRPGGLRRGIAAAVVPVADALVTEADEQAAAAAAAAEGDAAAILENAQAEAARILEQARSDGAAAGRAGAASALVATHRQARALVLGARRAAFEEVRRTALDELAARTTSAAGRALAERLATIVRERAGPGATVQSTTAGPLAVAATAGNRRAEVDLASLVDMALCDLADEVARLWS
jgi:vacuolar-type H+-ATPase subunit E/Vma4